LAERWVDVVELWEELSAGESRRRLPVSRRPENGVVRAVYEWASGTELEDLPDRLMAPGDFVRVSRQLVDLVRQVKDAFPEMSQTCSEALRGIDRGVVAAQGVG
jgi:ATP-dependent RNA helicase HelY